MKHDLHMPEPELLFLPMAGAEKIVLAVSGGPDSVALMLLASRWSARSAVNVVTIDHGLRPESTTEAHIAAEWATALGLPHQILVWRGDKPATGIQERARAARYALLLAYARQIGAAGIVTAHHADDQAETVLLRLAGGSGVAGLAGMRALSRRAGMAHWRPLLNLPKAALVNLCQSAGHPYFEDASNHNSAFARVRWRKLAATLERQGLTRDALARLSARAARAEDALEALADQHQQLWHGTRGAGGFQADGQFLATLPLEIALRLLAREILQVTGSAEPLRLERLERATHTLLAALAAKGTSATTLGGATLKLDKHGQLYVQPEPPRQRGRAALLPKASG